MFVKGLIFPGGREPVLEGDSLFLRYPETSDYGQWSKLREESRDFLTPWEPAWVSDELSRATFRRRLRRYAREIRDDLAYPFLVFRTCDEVLLGGCTVSNVRRGVTQCAAIGYWIGKPYARPPAGDPLKGPSHGADEAAVRGLRRVGRNDGK